MRGEQHLQTFAEDQFSEDRFSEEQSNIANLRAHPVAYGLLRLWCNDISPSREKEL